MKSFLIISALLLSACVVAPDVKVLQDEKASLEQQIASLNKRLAELEANNRVQQQTVAELNRVVGVLDTEKSSRVAESSSLRSQVRKFVQQQIDSLKEFLVLSDLLDYVGGELVERSQVEDKSLLLVDVANPIPRSGTLTGVSAHFVKPTPFVVKVMRRSEGQLVVVWQSSLIRVPATGMQRFNFPVTVGLEKNDVIAYFFPDTVGVSFDEGTSDVRYLNDDLGLGGNVKVSSLLGDTKKRAYSIGVYGLLD